MKNYPATKNSSRSQPLSPRQAERGTALYRWTMIIMTAVIVCLTAIPILTTRKPAQALMMKRRLAVVQMRVVDTSTAVGDVRIVIHPVPGESAKDYKVRPLHQAPKFTDVDGSTCFGQDCRNYSADLFDPAGIHLKTITLPSVGNVIVDIGLSGESPMEIFSS